MKRLCVAAALGMALPLANVSAGDLDPPGAPAGTFATLGDIHDASLAASGGKVPLVPADFNPATDFPIQISEPGSYVLTANLTAGENANGIVIAASDVTIDLGGFTLSGASGVGSGDGILVSDVAGPHRNIVVRNGTVRNWGADGIDLVDGTVCEISRVRVMDNGDDGIVTGAGARVRDCSAVDNGGDGIEVGAESMVFDCHAADQATESGITAGPGSLVRDNVSAGNFFGIEILDGECLVMNNIVHSNLQDGIHFRGDRSRIEANHVLNSGDDGIDRGSTGDTDNLIVRNSAEGSGDLEFGGTTDNDYGPIETDINVAGPWDNLQF